mgnify:CR=1 FL=1
MEPYLPKEIIYRPKSGLRVPLLSWLKVELSAYIDDLLCHHSLSARGLFNSERVGKLISDNKAGKVDVSYIIFPLICIEIECRQHLDLAPGVPILTLTGI